MTVRFAHVPWLRLVKQFPVTFSARKENVVDWPIFRYAFIAIAGGT
jgi:hypothetical protein